MLKYIIATLVIAAVWTAWWLLEFDMWIAYVATAAVVLLLIGLFVLERLRARRAAKRLEEALSQQGDEAAKGLRPDLQAEFQEMRLEFDKAVSALKTSKLGKGKAALYALPWHVIIGPPGAGKSTALRNSGLNFPYLSSTGGGVKGIGGTRNCDWWLTNEGVILDTAGRWTMQNEDRDEWLGFLDLLKRYRKRKPLNGVVVAVSITDLMGKTEQQVEVLGGQIRERLDEVLERLQISLPVYVLFTKCDLLPGFVETFGNLERGDRSGIWGYTAPVGKHIEDPSGYFGERFVELSGALERRCLYRMSEERRLVARERIFAFPQQFELLQQSLQSFVGHLFHTNVFKETPIMRGAYFTSGTQEGRPIDMVLQNMARSFGVASSVQLADPVVEQKSYFLGSVFSDVVFQDSDIAVRSPAEQKRQRKRRLISAAAIFAVATLISSVPTYAYIESSAQLSATQDAVNDVGPHIHGDGIISAEGISKIRKVYADLEDEPSVFAKLGMYRGDEVQPWVRRLYSKALRSRMAEHLVAADVTEMLNFGREFEAMGATAKPSPQQYSAMYRALRFHLLMTGPQEEREPALDEGLQEWLAEEITKRWAAALNVRRGQSDYRKIAQSAEFFASALATDDSLRLTRNDEAIERVRSTLSRVPIHEVVVGAIVQEVADQGYDLSLVRLTANQISGLTAENTIAGAFTRRAWEEKVRELLDNPAARFASDQWVMGRAAPSQERDDLLRLRSYYFRRYIAEWTNFLNGIHVAYPADDETRRTLLTALTNGSITPYQRLWRQMYYNMSLSEEDQDAVSQGTARAGSAIGRRITRGIQRAGPVGRILARSADAQMRSELSRPRGERLQDPNGYVMSFDVLAHFEGFLSFGVNLEDQSRELRTSLRRYLEELEWILQTMQNEGDVPARVATANTVAAQLLGVQPADWQPVIRGLIIPPIGQRPVAEPEGDSNTPATQPPRRRRRRR